MQGLPSGQDATHGAVPLVQATRWRKREKKEAWRHAGRICRTNIRGDTLGEKGEGVAQIGFENLFDHSPWKTHSEKVVQAHRF